MAIKTDKSTSTDDLDFLEGGNTGTDPKLPDFTSSGNIFNIPAGGLLGAANIGADGGTPGSILSGMPAGGFLSGSTVFNSPASSIDLGALFGNNAGSFLPGSLNLGGNVSFGSVVTMPTMVVVGTRTGPGFNVQTETSIFQNPTGGGFGTGQTDDIITMSPFVVSENRLTTPVIVTNTETTATGTSIVTTDDIITMSPFVVTENRITTPTVVITTGNPFTQPTTVTATDEVVTMTQFVVTDTRFTTPTLVTDTSPTVTFTTPPLTFTTPVITTTPTPSPTPSPSFAPTQPLPSAMPDAGTPSTSTTGTTGGQRDLKEELRKTLEALNMYQPQIQSMYGDLYKHFMPQGIKQSEAGIIDQYQRDLARLQQRQAGILAPEDIRQSQQAAREAYGARGQVMGRGAIGAEILNREAIRQQREDQARAAMQQSYGNILNMSNLQTGNLFSPIASLISGTFNPLGAYPADVYGTNVNAQLAREIAQKNYEAAVKSAELSGSAQKQAGTTSAIGNIFGSLLPAAITAICWVAREVYGEDNPRWMLFRDWLFRHAPEWFFNLYINHGEAFAGWLKRNSWAKRPIRIWMDSRIRSMEKRQLVLKEAV